MRLSEFETENAYDEGYRAGLSGEEQHTNPYPNGDIEHEFWSDGWEDAVEDTGFEGIEE